MLSRLELTNFKSFSNIDFDLRGKNGRPKKTAFIYGENGSGKSNLMNAFLFLSKTLNTLKNQEERKRFNDPDVFKKIMDTDEKNIDKDLLYSIINRHYFTLTNLINENKSINSNNMSLKIEFYINDKKGEYSLEFDNEKVIFEELRFQIVERMGVIFSINDQQTKLSESIFFDSEYRKELTTDVEKFWGKHTFASILFNEIESKNKKYINSKINSNLLDVLNWLNEISVMCNCEVGTSKIVSVSFEFLSKLEYGFVKNSEDKQLRAFEKFLNTFYTQLYSDVKSVYYLCTPNDDGYNYELFFKKQLNGTIVDVPFSLESTGTKKLLDVVPFIFASVCGDTVFLDEIDSGIHDLLMCEIIGFIMEAVTGQFIATTHNTLLMQKLPRENVFIINSDANGDKEIVCINDYSFRTQATHSLQRKYLDGAYNGIPYIGEIDLAEMVEEVQTELNQDSV